jgi:hypothetical protein
MASVLHPISSRCAPEGAHGVSAIWVPDIDIAPFSSSPRMGAVLLGDQPERRTKMAQV